MTVLIDPHLLIAPTTCGPIDQEAFWKRVVSIAGTSKVIGHEAFHWVIDQLGALGYPEQQVNFGPPTFGRECQIAMERILSRVSRGPGEAEALELTPAYLGEEAAQLAIVMDATEHRGELDALLSDYNYWSAPTDAINLGSDAVELLIDSELEPKAFDAARVKRVFAGLHLHVVGGGATPSAIDDFAHRLGIPEANVHWVESEKSKPPRDLDKTWGSLDPQRDVALCVTGRVSHATWEKGEKAATKRGLTMLECPSQGRIVDLLIAWSKKQSDPATDSDTSDAAA
ncbi:hypothetical protein [Microbacterium sp. A1-JK]|uniref:hypothetical protein n=1 Tax=Microbacterium sp. A1-JK TaxID=3177516 RepID=UPI00388B127E